MKKQICDMTKNEAFQLLKKKKNHLKHLMREVELIEEAIQVQFKISEADFISSLIDREIY